MRTSELLDLIANGENSGVEFKLDTVRPEQLAKDVVALANLNGGHILLGVGDEKSIVGITRKNVGEWVADTVFARYVHPLILPYIEEVVLDDGKRVAVVTIGREVSKPYVVRTDGRETAYVRIGSVSRQATREQLLNLGSASGFIHVEAMPVNRTDLHSLDRSRLENYLRDILQDPEVPTTTQEWINRLKNMGFMTERPDGEAICTIAGIVLFGIRPRQTLRQSGVRLLFFDALDKVYNAKLDRILDAPLVGRFQVSDSGRQLIDAGLIERTLDQIEPFITEEAAELDEDIRRQRRSLYPIKALRELIVNALAHRDWSRFVDVEISGYQDRLDIISPGALPNSMTVEKMLAGQRMARNPIIMEVLRDYGYVEARGMGVRAKVVPALKAHGLDWQVEATDDFVNVTLLNPEAAAGLVNERSIPRILTSPKRRVSVGKTSGKILQACRERASITIPELARRIGVTERSVQRNMRTLQNEGLLRRVGGRKEGRWEVLEKPLAPP